MATFNKFNCFTEDLAKGVHNMGTGTSHVFKIALTDTVPVATNTVLANITQIGAGTGYTAGGATAGTVTGSQTSGVFKLVLGTSPQWTASGSFGPVRYAVLYNDTPTSPNKPLIGWYDRGSSVTLASGETFTVTLDGTNGVLTIT